MNMWKRDLPPPHVWSEVAHYDWAPDGRPAWIRIKAKLCWCPARIHEPFAMMDPEGAPVEWVVCG